MSLKNNLGDYEETEIRGPAWIHFQDLIDAHLTGEQSVHVNTNLSQLFALKREASQWINHFAVNNGCSEDEVKLWKWSGVDKLTKNAMQGYYLKMRDVIIWVAYYHPSFRPTE